MRVTLSIDHVVKFMEAGKLDSIPTLLKYKQPLEASYKELQRLNVLASNPQGCSSCTQKNLRARKYSMLSIAIMALNAARDSGESLQSLIDMISATQGQEVTQLELAMPMTVQATSMPFATRTNIRAMPNVRNSVVLQGNKQ